MTRARDVSNIDGLLTAKGDIYAATAAGTPARLGVGANDLLLTADSTQATGLGYTGAWTTWTPTWTGLTVGNGTVIARYNKIGKVCHLFLKFTFGSTSSITAAKPYFTLPLTGSNDNLAANLWISDVGTNDFAGLVQIGTTAGFLVVQNASSTYSYISAITSTIPMTWTTNDSFTTNFSYEVA